MERTARSLLLDTGPAAEGELSLASIKNADWRHQNYALAHGYSSILALAVDEMLATLREMHGRLDLLESEVRALKGRTP